MNNYRGITLLSCLGKLFTSVINERLYSYLTNAKILGNEQAGFRPKHSTLDHIFALHVLSNYYINEKKQLYCAFVDYSKAFDLVDRVSLWQKLLANGISGKAFKIIYNIYEKAKSCVKVGDKISGIFNSNVGVRQGENLSPLLFAIYLSDFENFLSNKYSGLQYLDREIQTLLNDNELEHYIKLYTLL